MHDELTVPSSAEKLGKQLADLRNARRDQHAARRLLAIRRKSIRPADRAVILRKTAGLCHICGGKVGAGAGWQADHVLAHSKGGANSADNYLPAHSICNNYRWDYSPEEFQWVMKIGIWARKQMENPSGQGREMLKVFSATKSGGSNVARTESEKGLPGFTDTLTDAGETRQIPH